MKNKQIVIFVTLLAIWGVLFIITSNSKKNRTNVETTSSSSVREIGSKPKSDLVTSPSSVDIFSLRHNLILLNKTDIFFGGSSIKQNKPDNTLTVSVIKTPPPIKRVEVKHTTSTPVVITPTVVTPVPVPVEQAKVFIPQPIPEDVKVLSLINKIEISGLYKQGNNITIFLIYNGSWHEFKNEGILKVTTDISSYDLTIKALNASYVLIKQDNLQISLKKRIRGE